MIYLYLILCSFVIAIVFCSIIYPLILLWEKRVIKDFVYLLKDEYLIDSSIQEKRQKQLILFIISFMISYSFFEGIKYISSYTTEFNFILYSFFLLALLLIAYFYFQLVIVTDKRVIVKVLFSSFLLKNKEIRIDEIDFLSMSNAPQSIITLKDKTVHRIWLPKNNKKVFELFQGKLK